MISEANIVDCQSGMVGFSSHSLGTAVSLSYSSKLKSKRGAS
jgi:hypothetical protein